MRGFFLLITYRRPLRRTIWQSFDRRLIDDCTFITNTRKTKLYNSRPLTKGRKLAPGAAALAHLYEANLDSTTNLGRNATLGANLQSRATAWRRST